MARLGIIGALLLALLGPRVEAREWLESSGWE